jgi:small GTP-binding protein
MTVSTYDYLFKFVLVGNAGSGKSSLLERYVHDSFTIEYKPTVGVDFKVYQIEVLDDNKKPYQVKQQMWDLSGRERFAGITRSYFRGAQGIVVTIDLTDADGLKSLEKWLNRIRENCKVCPPILVVGTKCESGRKISPEDIARCLKENNLTSDDYIETDAKENIRVADVFKTLSMRTLRSVVKENTYEETATHIQTLKEKPHAISNQTIIEDLRKYIARIEKNTIEIDGKIQNNYAAGFKHFICLQAVNRHANYLLAKSLLDDLTTGQSVSATFNDVSRRRNAVANKQGLFTGFFSRLTNHGINSAELNKVIENARSLSVRAK